MTNVWFSGLVGLHDSTVWRKDRVDDEKELSGFLSPFALSAEQLAGEADRGLFRAVTSDPNRFLRGYTSLGSVKESMISVHGHTLLCCNWKMNVTSFQDSFIRTCINTNEGSARSAGQSMVPVGSDAWQWSIICSSTVYFKLRLCRIEYL